MSNTMVVIGRVVSDPKITSLEYGTKMTFSLADNEGNRESNFFGVSKVFRQKYPKIEKGDLVQVVGSLVVREKEDGTSLVLTTNKIEILETEVSKYVRKNFPLKNEVVEEGVS